MTRPSSAALCGLCLALTVAWAPIARAGTLTCHGVVYDSTTQQLNGQPLNHTAHNPDGSTTTVTASAPTVTRVVSYPSVSYSATLVIRTDNASFVYSDTNGVVERGSCTTTP